MSSTYRGRSGVMINLLDVAVRSIGQIVVAYHRDDSAWQGLQSDAVFQLQEVRISVPLSRREIVEVLHKRQ